MNDTELLDIINLIDDDKNSEALEKITDYLDTKASEIIDTYKKTVASTYFNEPVEQLPKEE